MENGVFVLVESLHTASAQRMDKTEKNHMGWSRVTGVTVKDTKWSKVCANVNVNGELSLTGCR